ncbi:UDP-glucuronosyltransferase 2A1-like [Elysia marginata]|uniref:UDP-glucuronosyltransferase 2A1-like n=1 Tax=Elysia marginata TaxID=1093978 RepID=A0AAV4JDD2_9GAST|nr:UDP-glucuronosyltransferase 2A1-like [Elysia marginata]
MVAKHGPTPRRFKTRHTRSKCGATGDFSRYHGQKRKPTKKLYKWLADVCERLLQQHMKRKLSYTGHIVRGSSGPLLLPSLEGKIEGKRRQGRPRRNWMDDVKEWSGSKSYGDTNGRSRTEKNGEIGLPTFETKTALDYHYYLEHVYMITLVS